MGSATLTERGEEAYIDRPQKLAVAGCLCGCRNFRPCEGSSDNTIEFEQDSKTKMKLKNLFESKVHQWVVSDLMN